MYLTPENLDYLCDLLGKMEGKYFDLVALARKSEEELATDLRGFRARMYRDYPEEVKLLSDPGTIGEWQDGFHCGMLAALRFVNMIVEDDSSGVPYDFSDRLAISQQLFPFLDT